MKELRPIKGHDGYAIDKDGNVYSYWVNKGIHGVHKNDKPKLLKGSKNKRGYITITFKGGAKKTVHRLVYETFVGEIPEGFVVRHLNDIPDDNRLENLAIGTPKENTLDCIRNGNMSVGKERWNSLFDEDDIRKIRSLKGKKTNKEIAEMYNCNPSTISCIQRGVTWKHVL
jgi:HNH endonuclease